MKIRYRYRLKPEVEKEFKETRLKDWEEYVNSYPNLSSEDQMRLKKILLHKLPGVDPEPLIEEAKKIKHKEIREEIIYRLKTYYYKSDIPVPSELIQGVDDKIGLLVFYP